MGACNSDFINDTKHKKNKTSPLSGTKPFKNNPLISSSPEKNYTSNFSSSTRALLHFQRNVPLYKMQYILPEYLSKRDDINKYYQINLTPKARGSYGEVFVATNEKGKKFAIKKILKNKIHSVKNIIQEAEISLKLNHKNIIKIYDIYEDFDYISYVMELGDLDLFDYMYNQKSSSLSAKLILEILIQLFQVIDYLHNTMNIIHCDIKPENFMIKFSENNKPILKLIDFGMAVYKPQKTTDRLSKFKGTREYSAPETFEGRYNEKVDEWALGIIMYTFLTGKDLFIADTDSEIIDNIKYQEICFDLIKDNELREINRKLLNRYISKRTSVKEALKELIGIYNSRIDTGYYDKRRENDNEGIRNDKNGNYNELYSKSFPLINKGELVGTYLQ